MFMCRWLTSLMANNICCWIQPRGSSAGAMNASVNGVMWTSLKPASWKRRAIRLGLEASKFTPTHSVTPSPATINEGVTFPNKECDNIYAADFTAAKFTTANMSSSTQRKPTPSLATSNGGMSSTDKTI